jgi:hypothetical protein
VRHALLHRAVAAQHQVVFHRHGAEQLALLGHQRQAQHHALFQRAAGQVLAVEDDAAARRQHAHQRVQRGDLPAPLGPMMVTTWPLGELEVQPGQHLGAAVAGVQVGDVRAACPTCQCSVPR